MTPGTRRPILAVITGCMDLTWLYAWAVYTSGPLLPGHLGLFRCAVVFWGTAALTLFITRRGLRAAATGVVLAAALAAGVLFVLHQAAAARQPYWRLTDWLGKLGETAHGHPWFGIAVVCFWAVLLLWAGVKLAHRTVDYDRVTSRFDLGLGAFFILFLIQMLVRTRYGGSADTVQYGCLMLSFFTFGVYSVGAARSLQTGKKCPAQRGNPAKHSSGFTAESGGMGMLLSFSLLLLFTGTGAALLLFPHLSGAAGAAYAGMKTVGTRVEPVLTAAIKLLFQPMAAGGRVETGGSLPEAAMNVRSGGRLSISALILLWFLLGTMGAAMLFLIGRTVRSWIRRILAAGPVPRKPGHGWSLRLIRLGAWWRALFRVLRARRRALGVLELYGQMMMWGKRSGVPRAIHETPIEYGERLAARFPDARADFIRIVAAFNLTMYGCVSEEQAGLREAQSSWRRLLRLWIARLRFLRRAGSMDEVKSTGRPDSSLS